MCWHASESIKTRDVGSTYFEAIGIFAWLVIYLLQSLCIPHGSFHIKGTLTQKVRTLCFFSNLPWLETLFARVLAMVTSNLDTFFEHPVADSISRRTGRAVPV